MHVVIGHHCLDDQSVIVGEMDEVCITCFESDVVVFPFKLLRKLLVYTVNISERPFLCLPDVSFLYPTHFSVTRSTEDRLDLVWGLCLRCIIMLPGFPIVNVVLEVPTVDEFLNLILKCNALFSGVTDVLMVSTIFILIPFGAISTQQVRPLEYPSLFCSHEDFLSWQDQVSVVSEFAGRRSWHSLIWSFGLLVCLF